MFQRKFVALVLATLTVLTLTTTAAQARNVPKPKPKPQDKTKNIPGKFDFYVLSLSWSPDYCATHSDPQQCGRPLSFVLHGLWPQYDRGWPANCTNETLTPAIKSQFPDLFPSPKLYDHEWSKHGTCSGLKPVQYLQLSKDLKESVKIPDRYTQPAKPFRTTIASLKQDFVQANPRFTPNSVATTCSGSGRFLQEIMICYSKDGQPGTCSEEILKRAQKSCGQPDFLVRSVR